MSNLKKVLSIMLLTIIIFGCQCGVQKQLTKTPTPIPPTYTKTIAPSKTATQIPSPTATSTPDISTEFRPLNEIDSISQFSDISGKIALLRANQRKFDELLLFHLSSMETESILEGLGISASVSPEHDLLAYRDFDSNITEISDINGKIMVQFNNTYGVPYSFWLNGNSLLAQSTWEKYPLYLYSLQKNQQTEIPQYVDMTDFDVYFEKSVVHYWGFYSYHKNVYDPNFEIVLYPDLSDDDIPQISLMNLNSGEIIGAYPTYHGWGNYPTWSLDGEKLAIGLNISDKSDFHQQEICIIKRDGAIDYTTTLGELFNRRFIQTISWSSDSRYLAFYFSSGENLYEHTNIVILDTKNESYIYFGEFPTDNHYQIFWSPDNKYLLIQEREINGTEERYIPAIIEVSTGNILYLEGDYNIAGWLK